MKKQLHNQLKELATVILNTENLSVLELKEKAQQLYEQATLLAYADTNEVVENSILEGVKEVQVINIKAEEKPPEAYSVHKIEDSQKREVQGKAEEVIEKKETLQEAPALLHELENLTKGFDLPDFEPMEVLKEVEPVSISSSETIVSKPKASLNDTLGKGFQVGLNDRLAFVNQLFDGNQEDYTRVISQLNTAETLSEAQQFINQIVKPEYNNWEGKETFELRFLDLVERNFQD